VVRVNHSAGEGPRLATAIVKALVASDAWVEAIKPTNHPTREAVETTQQYSLPLRVGCSVISAIPS
jgi:hypothetical protein